MVEVIKKGAYLAYGNTLIVDNGGAENQLRSLGKDNTTAETTKI